MEEQQDTTASLWANEYKSSAAFSGTEEVPTQPEDWDEEEDGPWTPPDVEGFGDELSGLPLVPNANERELSEEEKAEKMLELDTEDLEDR